MTAMEPAPYSLAFARQIQGKELSYNNIQDANAALNVLALVLLPQEWRHVGFAASTVVCSATGFALLCFAARKDGGLAALAGSLPAVLRILVAVAAMSAVLLIAKPFFSDANRILALAAEIAFGGATYAAIAFPLLRPRR